MIETKARKTVVRNILVIFLTLGSSLLLCTFLIFHQLSKNYETSKLINPDVRTQFSDFRNETMRAIRSLNNFARQLRPESKTHFLDWTRRLEQDQKQILSTWIVENPEQTRLHDLFEIQNKMEKEGTQLLNQINAGEQISDEKLFGFRSYRYKFIEIYSESLEHVASRINVAQQNLAAGSQRLTILVGIISGLGFVLTLVVPFVLKRSFDDYIEIKENSQKRITESEERFRRIFENEPQCVKLYDQAGALLDMNPAGLSMIEADSMTQVQGASVYDIINPKYRTMFIESANRVIKGQYEHLEFEIIGLKGTHRSMESYQVPLPDENGQIRSILAITYDVTQRRRDEQELKDHKEAMIHASRVNMMGELVSNIAHELNQPLTAVVNFAYLMEAEAENSDNQNLSELAELIKTESMRAAQIVAGLRRMVEKQSVEPEPEDLNSIVVQSRKLVGDEFKNKEIEYREVLANELPKVACDKTQIQQVLYNLVRNAIDAFDEVKTNDRMLSISTSVLENEIIEIKIEDTGPGIPNETLQMIFEPFFTQKENGLGMGLAVSRSIAEAHGGTLTVESEVGVGTTFQLTLPINNTSVANTNLEMNYETPV